MSMKRLIAVLAILTCGTVLRLDAEAAQEKRVRFALTGTLSIGSDYEGELGGYLGPGARIDVFLGKEITLTSEAMWILYWNSVAPAFTLNLRIGKYAYVGAGPFVTWATHDRGPVVSLKVRLGVLRAPFLFEFHYITAKPSASTWGATPKLLGMTFGFVF